jgi:ribosomal 50S subunit-recycling heat shock protein
MRLDKYLKVSRLIKRRTVAKEISDQGRIEINGKTAKSSSTVKEGDVLTIKFGQRIVTVKVEQIQETSRKDMASQMYSIIKEERVTEAE